VTFVIQFTIFYIFFYSLRTSRLKYIFLFCLSRIDYKPVLASVQGFSVSTWISYLLCM